MSSTEPFEVEYEGGVTVTYHDWEELDEHHPCDQWDPDGRCSSNADYLVTHSANGGEKKTAKLCHSCFSPPGADE